MVYEGERRFDLVVRMADMRDADAEKVKNMPGAFAQWLPDAARVNWLISASAARPRR